AIRVMGRFGPGSLLSEGVRASALRAVMWTAVAAIALVAVTVAAAIRARDRAAAARRSSRRSVPWDLVLLPLMAASLYEILTRGAQPVRLANGQAQVDVLLLVFPVFFIAIGAMAAARGLQRLL